MKNNLFINEDIKNLIIGKVFKTSENTIIAYLDDSPNEIIDLQEKYKNNKKYTFHIGYGDDYANAVTINY